MMSLSRFLNMPVIANNNRVHKDITFDWLLEQASDEKTRRNLKSMIASRRKFQSKGSDHLFGRNFILNLKGCKIMGRSNRPYSTMMVYKEMFQDDGHQQAEGFKTLSSGFIIDIGANEGLYAIRMCLRNPGVKVLCVEPEPSTCELLIANLKLNNLTDRTKVLKTAVWSNNEPQTLLSLPTNTSNAGLEGSPIRSPWLVGRRIKRTNVAALTLADVYKAAAVDEIDLLKIDTEGSELEILRGGTSVLPRIKRIVLEYHSADLRRQVIEFLEQNGFSRVHETEDKPVNLTSGDLYFVRQQLSGQ